MTEPLTNLQYVCDAHAPRPDPLWARAPVSWFVGKWVKKGFTTKDGTHNTEHLWVYVTGTIGKDVLTGPIENEPVYNVGVQYGEGAWVRLHEIETVLSQPGEEQP